MEGALCQELRKGEGLAWRGRTRGYECRCVDVFCVTSSRTPLLPASSSPLPLFALFVVSSAPWHVTLRPSLSLFRELPRGRGGGCPARTRGVRAQA